MKGLSSKDHPMYGRKHSEESKIKMSKSSKGKPSSFKGKKHNASSNEKNRQAHLGKKASDETRRRQREAAKRRKKPSKATGRKISQALKGKKKSKKGKPFFVFSAILRKSIQNLRWGEEGDPYLRGGFLLTIVLMVCTHSVTAPVPLSE